MSFAKIALFAFSFAAVVATGITANAAPYHQRAHHGWSGAMPQTVQPAEESLFQRAKGDLF